MNSRFSESHARLAQIVAGQIPVGVIHSAEWAKLAPLAVRQGLGPMLYRLLEQAGLAIDESLWASLEHSARVSAAHWTVLSAEQARLERATNQAGIPAVWLKGIALAGAIYPEPWCRPMNDLDVLVLGEQRAEAVRAVKNIGYRGPESDYLTILGAPERVRNHDRLLGGAGSGVMLEIHFRLLGVDGVRLLPPEQLAHFWKNTWPLEGAGLAGQTLRPETHLLYLCAHALLQHGEAYLNLLRLLDLHLLASNYDLDWDQVCQGACDLGWSYAVERGLQLATNLYHTPVPDSAWDVLKASRGLGSSRRTVTKLQQRTGRWEEWKTLFRYQTNAQRFHLVWATLFPPQAYVRELYELPQCGWVLPFYLYRWLDGGREIARSLFSRWSRPGAFEPQPESRLPSAKGRDPE